MKKYASHRVKALKRVFDQFDSDGSGELDAEETKLMLQKLGFDPTDEDVSRVLQRADNNKNNRIGFNEFAAGCLDISDSNLYSGIKRRTESGACLIDDLNSSTYLDPRKAKGISKKVWTKEDVERSLLSNSSDIAPLLPEKNKDIEDLKNLILEYETKLNNARARLAELENNTSLPVSETVSSLLTGVMNHANRANEIANLLKKDSVFSARLYKTTLDEDKIEVNMKTKNCSYYWSLEKFTERFAEMLNMLEDYKRCQENGIEYIDNVPEELNPFFDTDYQLIGKATTWLKSLGNMMESRVVSTIFGPSGQREGEIVVSIHPCDKNGDEGPWDEDDENDPFVDSAEELLGSEILFKIRISDVCFIGIDGVNPYSDTYIRYKIRLEDEDEIWSRTEKYKGESLLIKYNYEEEHRLFVHPEVVEHLTNGRILFEVWGHIRMVQTASMETDLTRSSSTKAEDTPKNKKVEMATKKETDLPRSFSTKGDDTPKNKKVEMATKKETDLTRCSSTKEENNTENMNKEKSEEMQAEKENTTKDTSLKIAVDDDADDHDMSYHAKTETKPLNGGRTPRQLGTLKVSLS